MTDDEKYRIIGRVVSDHEDSKKHLAALETKANTLGDFIQQVAIVLAGKSKLTIAPTGEILVKSSDASRGGRGVWPTLDEIRTLLDEIAATRTEIEQLARQRRELGV